jgi:excisionase family DNA binding protein
MALSNIGDERDGMPSGSVTVVNPASWASRPHELASLLAAAGGWPEGTKAIPDTRGGPSTSTFSVAEPLFWSSNVAELADVLKVAVSEGNARVDGPPLGSGVGAAPTSRERLTLTVEEAAAVLGISRAFAYDAVRRGEIPAIKIGRRILVPRLALGRLLETPGAGFSEEASGW